MSTKTLADVPPEEKGNLKKEGVVNAAQIDSNPNNGGPSGHRHSRRTRTGSCRGSASATQTASPARLRRLVWGDGRSAGGAVARHAGGLRGRTGAIHQRPFFERPSGNGATAVVCATGDAATVAAAVHEASCATRKSRAEGGGSCRHFGTSGFRTTGDCTTGGCATGCGSYAAGGCGPAGGCTTGGCAANCGGTRGYSATGGGSTTVQ